MKVRHAAALVVLTALGGCKLIDQTTFASSPEAPVKAADAPPPPSDPVDKRVPLLTVGFATPDPAYKQLLSYAVKQAESRKVDVAYDVVSVVPATGDAVAQGLAASRGADNAAQVMQSMISHGVPDTRVHLGSRTEAGLSESQVRVYIR